MTKLIWEAFIQASMWALILAWLALVLMIPVSILAMLWGWTWLPRPGAWLGTGIMAAVLGIALQELFD